MLSVNQIQVAYSDVQVLWDVSMKVQSKEFAAMVGANGAGKSTTLNTISALLRPRSGTIEFNGERIDRAPTSQVVELGISQVPEGRRLFPEMTVLENLELGSFMAEAKRRRNETIDWVYNIFPRLKERRNQLAGTLSGGEQQMVAVGRGLMSRPKLLMLDEPSLGLAPILVQEVFKSLERVNEEGVTILLVEQNVKHTLTIATHAYVLENGRVVMEGKGVDLLNNNHVKKAYLGI
ncbi:MAG TPA: ABC transporter ATP-binding protein [Thermodesulfobacteriota bacterium]|nr:ABC transporter ATP-binding protein [Thermodesulfobacteriota bacterium]